MSFGKMKTTVDEQLEKMVENKLSDLRDAKNKIYKAEVKGNSFDHLFIKVTGEDGFLTGASTWNQFEDIVTDLRALAKKENCDIKVTMIFA